MSELLAIDGLSVNFRQPGWRKPPVSAVDNVSFSIAAGETVGLAGESGSGKSTIGRCILGLTKPSAGKIFFDGQDISRVGRRRRRRMAADIQAVFQDPYSSLNPARSIRQSLREPLQAGRGFSKSAADQEIERLLECVGLPGDAADRYPNEFSGGQRQRIGIARALAPSPRLLICDEPVSALDVSTQAQILNLLAELQSSFQFAMLFIGHDLSVIRHISDRVVVPYQGQIMEMGATEQVCLRPAHPYTQALVASSPVPDPILQRDRRVQRLASISTNSSAGIGQTAKVGCPFAPRCAHASQVCWAVRPKKLSTHGITLACHMYDPDSGHPELWTPEAASDQIEHDRS